MADTKLDRQVKLSGALPAEDAENGLDYLSGHLADNPEGSLVLALVVLDVRSVTHDIVQDVYVPMLRIREIEAVPLDMAPDLYERLRDLRIARRGAEQDTLPEEPLPDLIDEEVAEWNEDHARLEDAVAIVPADEDAVVRFDKNRARR